MFYLTVPLSASKNSTVKRHRCISRFLSAS